MARLTVVIGGGQAGLSVSQEALAVGVEHVVLEQGRVAQADCHDPARVLRSAVARVGRPALG